MKRHLRKILSDILPREELAYIYNSYDIVGDIAVIRLNEKSKKHDTVIAEAVFKIHRNVKTVLAQTGPVRGDFRLRRLEYVAGENKFTTVHRERARVERVYSIDVNPIAIRYMQENIRLNRVYGKVVPLQGDAREIIERRLRHVADRIIMPLPEKAFEYLPCAVLTLKNKRGVVHFYNFEYASKNENAVENVRRNITKRLESSSVNFEIPFGRVVRTVGPNWYQIVIDIVVKG